MRQSPGSFTLSLLCATVQHCGLHAAKTEQQPQAMHFNSHYCTVVRLRGVPQITTKGALPGLRQEGAEVSALSLACLSSTG